MQTSDPVGVTGHPWTETEIEATVAAYFEMLAMQFAGEHFTKVDFVRRLQALMPARNARAIESKFQNISAILTEIGLDWMEGYRPLPHYQRALRDAVLAAVAGPYRVREAMETYESSSLVAPSTRRHATEDVLVPTPAGGSPGRRRSSVALTGSTVSALRDFRAHQLGSAGERWVVELERESLRRAGRPDLAGRVQWVAHDVGDGLGFDMASFRADGADRLIEVKTTNLGRLTPFYITRWEIDVSRDRADVYSLYRVHGFARDPRIYVLGGTERSRRGSTRVYSWAYRSPRSDDSAHTAARLDRLLALPAADLAAAVNPDRRR